MARPARLLFVGKRRTAFEKVVVGKERLRTEERCDQEIEKREEGKEKIVKGRKVRQGLRGK